MNRDLVVARKWLTSEEYNRGLAFSQLAPGPLAAQLAMYIGFVRAGFLGATVIAGVFILPSFLMVVGLGALYVTYGGLTWLHAIFYGIGAAVIGIIIRSAHKLAQRTMKKDKLLWAIGAITFAVTAITEHESVWLFLAAGVLLVAISIWRLKPKEHPKHTEQTTYTSKPFTLYPLPLTLAPASTIFLFFLKSSLFVFGSGLAIVPFLYGGVVTEHHWLNDRQFIDAVAVAMITPGPVVITVGFIGYLVHGLTGALAASLGVFLPVYLFVVLLAPPFERFANNAHVQAFVRGVSAAATGAIAGAVVVLGRRAIVDWPTAAIAIIAAALLYKFKIPEPVIIAAAGVVGYIIAS